MSYTAALAAGYARRDGTYLFGEIVENVGLQHHYVHEDGAHDPAQLALPHVQHSLHPPCLLPAEFIVVPGFLGDALDVVLEQGQSHKVEVGVLGGVFAVLRVRELKGV